MANLLAALSERGSFHPSQGLWEPQVPRTKTEMDSAATRRKIAAVIWGGGVIFLPSFSIQPWVLVNCSVCIWKQNSSPALDVFWRGCTEDRRPAPLTKPRPGAHSDSQLVWIQSEVIPTEVGKGVGKELTLEDCHRPCHWGCHGFNLEVVENVQTNWLLKGWNNCKMESDTTLPQSILQPPGFAECLEDWGALGEVSVVILRLGTWCIWMTTLSTGQGTMCIEWCNKNPRGNKIQQHLQNSFGNGFSRRFLDSFLDVQLIKEV